MIVGISVNVRIILRSTFRVLVRDRLLCYSFDSVTSISCTPY